MNCQKLPLLLTLSLLLLSLLSLHSASAAAGDLLFGRSDGHELAELDKRWSQFKVTFGRSYASAGEERRRFVAFAENLRRIAEHNRLADAGLKTYWLGVNHFADLTHREFRQRMSGCLLDRPIDPEALSNGSLSDEQQQQQQQQQEQLPQTVDWRKKGAVTSVKDQGRCGSCWSFSTTGALEGQHYLKTRRLVSLSEQQLVDCSVSYGNKGCQGGLMTAAFSYLRQYGSETEAAYPYRARQGACRYSRQYVAASCAGYRNVVPQGSELALKRAVAQVGPVSVAIDASHPSFQLYSHGVYNEPSCSSTLLDHGVLVVGYGSSGAADYWLVKNSWNTAWGEGGYIRMSRNRRNQCGIATSASYPLV